MSQALKEVESGLKTSVDKFSVDFLRKIFKNKKESILVSPIGIIALYTILLEGAQGRTADQIMQIFHLKPQFKNVGEVRVQLKKLIKALNQQDQDLTIRMANKLVMIQDIPLKSRYREIIEKNYSATIDKEDHNEPGVLMEKLNKWVADTTDNMITQLFDEPFDPRDILVLINVLYFKGFWSDDFELSTEKECFHNYDGTESDIKMMYITNKHYQFCHLKDEKLKIVKLPYKKGANTYIFLPLEANSIQTFIDNLEGDKIERYIQSLGATNLSLIKMPKFQIVDFHELSKILPAMGLELPFSISAEIKGITEVLDKSFFISKSAQKAIIIVDEKGTQAAAATVAVSLFACRYRSLAPVNDFIADRPFVFIIREEESSVNLFVGAIKKFPNSRPPRATPIPAPAPAPTPAPAPASFDSESDSEEPESVVQKPKKKSFKSYFPWLFRKR